MSNNNPIKWSQLVVLIALATLLGSVFLWTNTKADKTELKDTEIRMEKKVDRLQESIQRDVREIKDTILRMEKKNDAKQDKIYDLLMGKTVVSPLQPLGRGVPR